MDGVTGDDLVSAMMRNVFGNQISVRTFRLDGTVVQEILDPRSEITRKVADVAAAQMDEAIVAELIALGWTPPPDDITKKVLECKDFVPGSAVDYLHGLHPAQKALRRLQALSECRTRSQEYRDTMRDAANILSTQINGGKV